MKPEILTTGKWRGGLLFAFSGIDGATDFNSGLAARTSFDSPGLDIMLPGLCRVRFPIPTATDFLQAGDFLETRAGDRIAKAAFIDAFHILVHGDCQVSDRCDAIRSASKDGKTLIGSASRFNPELLRLDIDFVCEQRSAWLRNTLARSLSPAPADKTLCRALCVMKTQVMTPEGNIRRRWSTPDRWPHRGMWLWDSVFHAAGWRHIDAGLARDMIGAVLDAQREDGFVPHYIAPGSSSKITQPPVLALGVKLVNEIEPDPEWTRTLYPRLYAFIGWIFKNRDSDGAGLVEWHIEDSPVCRSGESGMDNSPRFDSARALDAVDFNSYLALECEILAGFAESLGLPDDARRWKNEHARLCRLINERLWSESDRFYVDRDVASDRLSPVLSSAGFLPLICGAPSREQAKALAGHLSDPGMFGTALPVPSIAAKDAAHYQKDMWRGPVWVNINWLIARGFDRYGMRDVADALRGATMTEIERQCEKNGALFEYYDDRRELDPPSLLRKGECAPEKSPFNQAIYDYGWTAALYLDMRLAPGNASA